MKRNFEFTYHFNHVDFKICFDYEISDFEIEERIKEYINKKNIIKEDIYLINLNNNVELEFNIVDISDGEYSIEIDNVFLYN